MISHTAVRLERALFSTHRKASMYVVVTRLSFPEGLAAEAARLAAQSAPLFKKQPGFRAMKNFAAEDAKSRITVLEWESKDDHERCMASSDFAEVNQSWGALFQGGASFEMWSGQAG